MLDKVAVLEARLSLLMQAALAGNADAYRALLGEADRYLRRYFLRHLGRDRTADAEDLTQETLLALHTRRATYDADRPFTAWMHGIARYKLLDHFRRLRVQATLPLTDAAGLFSPEETEAALARLDVERLLGHVPARTRGLIRRVRLDGESVAEVATATGLSPSAIKIGIHRGLKRLALKLREDG